MSSCAHGCCRGCRDVRRALLLLSMSAQRGTSDLTAQRVKTLRAILMRYSLGHHRLGVPVAITKRIAIGEQWRSQARFLGSV